MLPCLNLKLIIILIFILFKFIFHIIGKFNLRKNKNLDILINKIK
jgi:hypothetical protein